MTHSQRARTKASNGTRLGFAYPALILLVMVCFFSSTGCLSVRDRLEGLDLNPFVSSDETPDLEEDLKDSGEGELIALDDPYIFDKEDADPEETEDAFTVKTGALEGEVQFSESFLEQERLLVERERELERRERELEEAWAARNGVETPPVAIEQSVPTLSSDLVASPVRATLAPVANDPPPQPVVPSEERLDFARSMVEAHDLALSGDFIESQMLYERIVEAYPNRYEPYHHLAVIADCQKRYGQAIAWYVQAAELEPSNGEILHDLGRCLAQQERFEDAEAALRRAVEAAPEETLYRETLAINLAQREQYSSALDELVHVMSEADAYYKIAEILEQKNHEEGVKECLVLALESNPTHGPSLNWLQELAREEEERTSTTISPQSEWEPSYARTSSQPVETTPEQQPAQPLAIPAAPSAPAPLPVGSAPESIAIPDFQIPEQREEAAAIPAAPIDESEDSGESAFGRSSLYHTSKLSTGVSGWQPRGATGEAAVADEAEPTPVLQGDPSAWNSDISSPDVDESGTVFPLIRPGAVSTSLGESETKNVTLLDTPEIMR